MEYTKDEIKEIIKITILCILTIGAIGYSFYLDEKTNENIRGSNYIILDDEVYDRYSTDDK